MSQTYDAIVCGAGPSGATAARYAAAAGLRVALIEKQRLPRHKPCGGGMPVRAGRWLHEDVPEAAVECCVRHLRHTWNFQEVHWGAVQPDDRDDLSLWMVQRPRFDNALVESAAAAGAQVCDAMVVRSLDLEATGVTVRASGLGDRRNATWTGRARHLIGADGANGIVAKAAGLRSRRRLAFAIETEIPHEWTGDRHPDLRPDVAHLEYGAVSRGYAWIFPKRHSLNVGAGVFYLGSGNTSGRWRQLRSTLEQTVWAYGDRLGLQPDRDRLPLYAHPLPLWQGREPRHSRDGRVLLVGDAAGLVNPFFGDGILHGIKSGAIAAGAIADGHPTQYTRRLHAEVATNFEAARLLAGFFYRFPHWCFQNVVRRANGTQVAARLLAGDLEFSQVAPRFAGYVGRKAIGLG